MSRGPFVAFAAAAGCLLVVSAAGGATRADSPSVTVPPTSAGLDDFCDTAQDRLPAPRVLYEARSGRWFASISDIDTNSVLLAVSRTSDPTGSWSTYSFGASGCADQPRLGIADGIVVLAADVF